MATWAPKDPDAILDYVYRIPLDAGDSVSSSTPWVTAISGTVVIDSQALAGAPDTTDEGYGQDVTVWLSGGTDGEIAVFRAAWETTLGREDDDTITLQVFENDVVPLVLTGYAKPVPANLIMRYAAFASVNKGTIQYWLTDAERYVTDAWTQGDYAAGLMALAAHNLTLAGYGTDATPLSGVPTGISRLRSGSLDVTFTDVAANSRLAGDLSSTRYGQEYLALLERNRCGPIIAPTGVPPYSISPDFPPW